MTFNAEIQNLVNEYNVYSRANTMLYKNPDVAEMLLSLYTIDRFQFTMKCSKIEMELISLITPYHNKPVTITDKYGNTIHGVIEHLPTREYTESNGNKRTTNNNVSFRYYDNDSQGIALWVNTGDVKTTHLYNADMIELQG
jgi:hypothetical protein